MFRISIVAAGLLAGSLVGSVVAGETCVPGSYSIVTSPDGTALSILFDDMVADSVTLRRTCAVHVPLSLPEGQSLGVYRVDYRGYGHITTKGFGELSVDYTFGPNKARRFARKLKGPMDEDFTFTENIGVGLMKRAGCGANAALDVTVGIALPAQAHKDDIASVDSADGAPRGVVYHFDFKKCHP